MCFYDTRHGIVYDLPDVSTLAQAYFKLYKIVVPRYYLLEDFQSAWENNFIEVDVITYKGL